jgi:hypothetical protein
MTINELMAAVGLTEEDMISIYDSEAAAGTEPTQKITAQQLADAIKSLASLLGTGDVVNDLTSTATDKPLSAAQGKALKDTMIKNNAQNLELMTIGSGKIEVASLSGYTGLRLINVVAIGEYPEGTMQKFIIVSSWIKGDNLYVAIQNISENSHTGVLQVLASYTTA